MQYILSRNQFISNYKINTFEILNIKKRLTMGNLLQDLIKTNIN